MADMIETDLTTDPPTVTERAFTPEELAQREKDAADYEAAHAAAQAKAIADALARDAAIAHAKSLGFSDDMIAVMYPSLIASSLTNSTAGHM